MTGVLLAGDVPDAPLDVGVGVGLDEGVDGPDDALLVAVVAGAGVEEVVGALLGLRDGVEVAHAHPGGEGLDALQALDALAGPDGEVLVLLLHGLAARAHEGLEVCNTGNEEK